MGQRRSCFRKEQRQRKRSEKGIVRLLALYLISSVLCVACLAGTTRAWFTESVAITSQTMQAASFDLSVSVIRVAGEGEEKQEISPENGIYCLSGNSKYTVTLTAEGDASRGYCVISNGTEIWYTSEIISGEEFFFQINTGTEDQEYIFSAQWGIPADEEGKQVIKAGDEIGNSSLYTQEIMGIVIRKETSGIPENSQNSNMEQEMISGNESGETSEVILPEENQDELMENTAENQEEDFAESTDTEGMPSDGMVQDPGSGETEENKEELLPGDDQNDSSEKNDLAAEP